GRSRGWRSPRDGSRPAPAARTARSAAPRWDAPARRSLRPPHKARPCAAASLDTPARARGWARTKARRQGECGFGSRFPPPGSALEAAQDERRVLGHDGPDDRFLARAHVLPAGAAQDGFAREAERQRLAEQGVETHDALVLRDALAEIGPDQRR